MEWIHPLENFTHFCFFSPPLCIVFFFLRGDPFYPPPPCFSSPRRPRLRQLPSSSSSSSPSPVTCRIPAHRYHRPFHEFALAKCQRAKTPRRRAKGSPPPPPLALMKYAECSSPSPHAASKRWEGGLPPLKGIFRVKCRNLLFWSPNEQGDIFSSSSRTVERRIASCVLYPRNKDHAYG